MFLKYSVFMANFSFTVKIQFLLFLTFIGPCIVRCFYNKSQRDALFLNFILVKNYTFF